MLDLPQLCEGQTIQVTQKIVEGKKERNVPFTGKLLKVRGIGVNKTITVRQTLEGVDVDRIFPIASPIITGIEVFEEKKKKTPAKRSAKSSRKRPRKTKK